MTLRFARQPFRPSPAPDLYVATPSHETALAQLRYSLASGHGLTLFDGASGTGKTIVALKLLADHASTTTPVYLPNARFERPADLHQAILFDLGKPHEGRSDGELRLACHDAVLANAAASRRTILVLDDAENLGDAALDELRGFDNLSVRGTPAISILLVTGPSLRERLAKSTVASRMGPPCRLQSLTEKSAADYIRKQAENFSDEAIAMIATHSYGVPRMINGIASLAMALAAEAGEENVDVEAVLEALARMTRPEEPAHLPRAADSAGLRASHSMTPDESAAGRTPKQKARKRKAA